MRWLHRAGPWSLRYQVVKLFFNGAVIVVCGHRTWYGALLCSDFRHSLDPRSDVTHVYDVRFTPGDDVSPCETG